MASRLHENTKFAGGLTPQTVASTTVKGAFIPVSGFRQVLALLSCAVIATGKSAVLQLVQAKDDDGTDEKDIGGATITLDGADATKSGFVEIKSGDLDRGNNYNHIAVKVTTDADIICSVNTLLGSGRFTPSQDIEYAVL